MNKNLYGLIGLIFLLQPVFGAEKRSTGIEKDTRELWHKLNMKCAQIDRSKNHMFYASYDFISPDVIKFSVYSTRAAKSEDYKKFYTTVLDCTYDTAKGSNPKIKQSFHTGFMPE